MKLKEKAIEIKEKTKVWIKEHKEELVATGLFVGGWMATIIWADGKGRAVGYIKGRDSILGEFGDEPDNLNTIRRCKDRSVEAIMTNDFFDLIQKNADLVVHDDGSWDFQSEVEHK